MKRIVLSSLLSLVLTSAFSQTSLLERQQQFVDLQFGMFIHYNIPTYAPEDWPDPDLSPAVFNPTRLDCRQWAQAAKDAHMSYGCLTTKHHSGFCIWNTRTTDYNVMQSPLKRDVVREFVDAFRAEGLKVMLYYSILDTHHRLRPGHIEPWKISMVKAQLTELLTGYGPIEALIIDGWDAPWSRISYDEVPFGEIYALVKRLQPDCLVMDLNAAKYPREGLFYTDIKSYEQGAGQKISTSDNRLPALACLPLQRTWFWKESMPTDELRSPQWLVDENIRPYTEKAYCNFILNAAPNRDGLIDDNAVAALREIGRLWTPLRQTPRLPANDGPIIGRNIAKGKPAESSWSYDMNIMDFANDDDFTTSWQSHRLVENPWWTVDLQEPQPISMVTITEGGTPSLKAYRLEYALNGEWHVLFDGPSPNTLRVKTHRFPAVVADHVRITITDSAEAPSIAEFGVYQ